MNRFRACLPVLGYQLKRAAYGAKSNACHRQKSTTMAEVRQVLRLHHYAIRTERSYADCIARVVQQGFAL